MDTARLFELVEEAGVREEVQGLSGVYNKIRPFLADASGLSAEQIGVNRVGKAGDVGTRLDAIEKRCKRLPPGTPFVVGIVYSGEGGPDYDKVVGHLYERMPGIGSAVVFDGNAGYEVSTLLVREAESDAALAAVAALGLEESKIERLGEFAPSHEPSPAPDEPAVWLEFTSSADEHGGTGWEFGTCLWSPTANRVGHDTYGVMRFPKAGDLVVHSLDARLVGFSTVRASALETEDGFYPASADTSEQAHFGSKGVSWPSEGSTAKSSSERRWG